MSGELKGEDISSPNPQMSEEQMMEEIKYLIKYLDDFRPVGACMRSRIKIVLKDQLDIMEQVYG